MNYSHLKCKKCGFDVPMPAAYCPWCGRWLFCPPGETITVPRAIQLPSGKWRIQLRREGKSFTDQDRTKVEKDALAYRKQWLQDHPKDAGKKKDKLTLGKLVDDYIDSKAKVLSVSTLKAYRAYRRNVFNDYLDLTPDQIDFQEMINSAIDGSFSPKYISNAWGLCSSAMRYYDVPHKTPTLPKGVSNERDWLDYKQIQTFTELIRGKEFELPALLALHSLRRSEIFGLRPSDYEGTANPPVIHIRGALLRAEGGGWIHTDLNKTTVSRRDVPIVIPRLKELLDSADMTGEYIVMNRRDNLWKDINTLCENAGLPRPGLHGLRHSFASLAYHLGWKKKSTMTMGGWATSTVLDKVYTHNADMETDLQTMTDFFRE